MNLKKGEGRHMGEHTTPPMKRHGFVQELWQASQAGSALYLLYSFAAHVASGLAALGDRKAEAAAAATVPLITVTLPDPIAEVVIACAVVGIITYMGLKYVCEGEWVQEPVEVKECWKEFRWYNPWTWVKVLVCTVKEVLKWVFKIICGWVWALVIVLVVSCIIVGIILLA